jgi:transcriptional regulator with XRE-family HTH domain
MQNETMGQRIRLLRESRGYTQEQLGELVGVSKGAVSQWELGGVANIKLKTFLSLCEVLGTTWNYLVLGPERTSPAPPSGTRKGRVS